MPKADSLAHAVYNFLAIALWAVAARVGWEVGGWLVTLVRHH